MPVSSRRGTAGCLRTPRGVWDDERGVGEDDAEPTDESLCERVAGRDDAAFEALVVRYGERAYRIAWSIVRDAEDARDLSQEAFIRLYQHAESFQRRSRFSTWFYRILVNLCLDHRRKHRWWRTMLIRGDHDEPVDAVLERQPAPVLDPLGGLGRDETLARVWAVVGRLSPQQRAVVTLQVQEHMDTAEIARVLRCSEATVRVHLHRALVTLRRSMESGR
jgi:RNA polymerase sigma-70 factor, ECF subfamily